MSAFRVLARRVTASRLRYPIGGPRGIHEVSVKGVPGLVLRPATQEDCPAIISLIQGLR